MRSIFCANDLRRTDGTVISAVDQDGSVLDASFDLYNQAFALLAYACGHPSRSSGDWQSQGYSLLRHSGGSSRIRPADFAKTVKAA